MAQKRFKHIKNEFGLVDEQATQEAFETFVGGINRAERLVWLWNNSYPSGTAYDRMFRANSYQSKENIFKNKAKREGFADEQIKAFLSL